MARKSDKRSRRVRNTLTVDLGVYGLPLMDACLDDVRNMLNARSPGRGRRVTRGQVVRVALQSLHLLYIGHRDPLKIALDAQG